MPGCRGREVELAINHHSRSTQRGAEFLQFGPDSVTDEGKMRWNVEAARAAEPPF
jgi:hypothetical protein